MWEEGGLGDMGERRNRVKTRFCFAHFNHHCSPWVQIQRAFWQGYFNTNLSRMYATYHEPRHSRQPMIHRPPRWPTNQYTGHRFNSCWYFEFFHDKQSSIYLVQDLSSYSSEALTLLWWSTFHCRCLWNTWNYMILSARDYTVLPLLGSTITDCSRGRGQTSKSAWPFASWFGRHW